MPSFKRIHDKAVKRAGGKAELAKLLPKASSARKLKAVSDDRYLSLISRRVFQAGLKHSLVDNKWPAFEEVFHGFDPRRVAAMHDEQLEQLMQDKRLIRHWPKLNSVPVNAAAINTIAKEAGSFGGWLAAWPATDIVGLWAEIGSRFKQMGGNSTPYFLRMAGKDTFIFTPDVVRALIGLGVVDKKPTGKRDMAKAQDAFNQWADETGLELGALSRTLALSVD